VDAEEARGLGPAEALVFEGGDDPLPERLLGLGANDLASELSIQLT
jgi:hypothetical protein